METLYGINGFPFWNEKEIRDREMIRDYFDRTMRTTILDINPGVDIRMVEAPTLIRWADINPGYTEEDIWVIKEEELGHRFDGMVLRPETTPGTYFVAKDLLNRRAIKPPFCLYQCGKSYRREQEHPSKYMRLREFYQMEWQWLYTEDTANDYHAAILEPVRKMIADMVGKDTRLTPSDRLPGYSQITTDVEVWLDRWMELASISRRFDFSEKARFQTKKGEVEKGLLNVEVAIGLDRCLYAYTQRTGGDSHGC